MNTSLLYQGLVTYATGAMVALFLSIFNLDTVRARALRANVHARTFFYILLSDLLIIALAGVLLVPLTEAPGKAMNLIGLVVMLTFSVSLTRMIAKLIRIIL
ncbi:MAG TPA: hypothetical protein VLA88_05740 [Candidatus Saccharimonadales bacterium]|nr:hypothetical protein [Candidatus Saccharimonadales bacterium]